MARLHRQTLGLPVTRYKVYYKSRRTTDLVEDEQFRDVTVRPVSDLVRDDGQYFAVGIEAAHRAEALLGQQPVVQHDARAEAEPVQVGVYLRQPLTQSTALDVSHSNNNN